MTHPLARAATTLAVTPMLLLALAAPAFATSDAPTVASPVAQTGYGFPSTGYYLPQTRPDAASYASATQASGVVLINTVVDYGQSAAAGTGLILSSSGLVVTNHHVVAGSTQVKVTDPASGEQYLADVVGYEPDTDVAVLKLEGASGLTPVTTDPTAVSPGEGVTAVGNSNGGGVLTAATGQVTGTGSAIDVRGDDGSVEHLTNLIEVDATVVPGDSGGALLDADGEVVGMNVAADANGTQGYAIPISTVLYLAGKIVKGDASGAVRLGYGPALGLQLAESRSGLYISGVVRDGAADRAGVAPGSLLIGLDGTRVESYQDLATRLNQHKPGDAIELTWIDSEAGAVTATLTLGRAPLA